MAVGLPHVRSLGVVVLVLVSACVLGSHGKGVAFVPAPLARMDEPRRDPTPTRNPIEGPIGNPFVERASPRAPSAREAASPWSLAARLAASLARFASTGELPLMQLEGQLD